MAKTSKRESINKKVEELEAIVKKFENGKVNIEEGIEEYGKAAKLIKDIKKELSSIELKIEEIQKSYN